MVSPIIPNYFNNRLLLSLFTSALVLIGCAHQPETQAPIDTPIIKQPTQSKATPKSPEELIAQAYTATQAEYKNSLLIAAATQYFEGGQSSQAKAALREVSEDHLSGNLRSHYWTLVFNIAKEHNDENRLSQALENIDANTLLKTDIETQEKIVNSLVEGYEQTEQYLEAAKLLHQSKGLLETNTNLYDHVWRLLSKLSLEELTNQTSDDRDFSGWLSLATQMKLSGQSLEEQYQSLLEWQIEWPEHSSITSPPQELAMLARLPEFKPEKIVLALPFSGPLAKIGFAIRDGFMASYLSSNNPTSDKAELVFFDTHANSFSDVYLQDNPDKTVIVGPLSKTNVRSLYSLDELPIKTLALNRDENAPLVKNLWEISLQPESEASQIAEKLADKGYRRVGLLTPKTGWGKRVTTTLEGVTKSENNVVIESVHYENQRGLSKAVAELLGTERSKERFKRVRAITGLNLESKTRRRKDIDAIVFAGKPEFARQIKPLIAYHYGGDLPIFSSSRAHDLNPEQDERDLNGLYITEIPWLLGLGKHQELRAQVQSKSKHQSRFFALGMDTHLIAPRLELLSKVQNSQVSGHTGTLSFENNQTQRTMHWAKYKKGKPQPIENF